MLNIDEEVVSRIIEPAVFLTLHVLPKLMYARASEPGEVQRRKTAAELSLESSFLSCCGARDSPTESIVKPDREIFETFMDRMNKVDRRTVIVLSQKLQDRTEKTSALYDRVKISAAELCKNLH